ncbi:MAG: hypothetical protein KGI27_06005 [Thaumarchaeota archaeon]|nr:hypothetical protein [Nitrososphaerota archaeon]
MIRFWYLIPLCLLGVSGVGLAYGDDSNCYHAYSVTTDKHLYKPGETVMMTFASEFANCGGQNIPFRLTIINQTGGLSDVVFQKVLLYNPGVTFNYTLPAASTLPVLDRYEIDSLANSTNGPGAGQAYILVKENEQNQSYDFQIWPYQSAVTRGSNVFIMSQLCPIPDSDPGLQPVSDEKTGLIKVPGTGVLVNYYFTAPNGTQIIRQDGMGDAECYNSQARGEISSNDVGTWSVYAIAEWIENNSTHTIKSKTIDFQIQEPVTDVANVTKIFDTKDAYNGSNYNNKGTVSFDQIDWSHDGRFILVSANVDQEQKLWLVDMQSTKSQEIAIPSPITVYEPRISPTGDSIIFIGSNSTSAPHVVQNLFKYNVSDGKLVQLTNGTIYDMVQSAVWTSDGNIVYSEPHSKYPVDYTSPTDLWLANSDGIKLIKIHEEPRGFLVWDVSNDGKKILLSDARIVDRDTGNVTMVQGTYGTNWMRFTPYDNLFVYSVGNYESVGGTIDLGSSNGYQQTLYRMQSATPGYAVMSPDGRNIAFVVNEGQSNTGGVYVMALTRPIPEFPFSLTVLLIGITSLIAFYNIVIRKRKLSFYNVGY